MVMTDPIADFLTRIRNGYQARKEAVELPFSKVKREIARVLKSRQYIFDYEVAGEGKKSVLRVYLQYHDGKTPAVEVIRRRSRPGQREYVGHEGIPRVLEGFGMAVLSTPKGILSDQEARDSGVGGEVLLEVW